MTLSKISPRDAAARLASGEAELVDIRATDEYRREHIRGARSVPLDDVEAHASGLDRSKTIFMCRSGNRTDVHCQRLADAAGGDAMILEGGLQGWQSAGLPTVADKKAPLEIMRQVQITAGSLVLIGVILGTLVHPGFYGLSAFVGAGLTFAGASGWCGMAKLLGVLPWNRTEGSSAS